MANLHECIQFLTIEAAYLRLGDVLVPFEEDSFARGMVVELAMRQYPSAGPEKFEPFKVLIKLDCGTTHLVWPDSKYKVLRQEAIGL